MFIGADHHLPFSERNHDRTLEDLDVFLDTLLKGEVVQELRVDGRIGLFGLDGLVQSGLDLGRQLADVGLTRDGRRHKRADQEHENQRGDDYPNVLHGFPPMQLKTATSVW